MNHYMLGYAEIKRRQKQQLLADLTYYLLVAFAGIFTGAVTAFVIARSLYLSGYWS